MTRLVRSVAAVATVDAWTEESAPKMLDGRTHPKQRRRHA
jgi:hypothetical protein